MGQVWYCVIDGREEGPFNATQLRVMSEQKRLLPSHHVRLVGRDGWLVAAKVKGLFDPQPELAQSQSARRWIVKSGDKDFGPFTETQLKQLAIKGELKLGHLVKVDGSSEWYEASRIPGLFDGGPSKSAATTASPTALQEEIAFSCVHCGRTLRCKHSSAGKTFPCPACKQPVTVPAAPPQSPRPPLVTPSVANTSKLADEPVIVQAKRVGAQVAEKIDSIWRFVGDLAASRRERDQNDHRPPKDIVRFYGAGDLVDLGRGPIKAPLVYATGQRFSRVYDASLIELPLPTANSSRPPEPLPYWPTYHEATPRQRTHYLDWLYSGRRDPDTELGYVFIYFYGLERRVLIDDKDHALVIEEVLRLLSIYGRSNSFRTYAFGLMWLAAYLSASQGGLPGDLLPRLLSSTTRWCEDSLRCCLAYHGRQGMLLSKEAAFVVASQDERSVSSVVVKRHAEKFDALFAARFEESFPNGFALPEKFRERKIYYRPGSATLLALRNAPPAIAEKTIPSYNLSLKHFEKLASHWNGCVEELKGFDRVSRKSSSEGLTGEAYESLPTELRTGDHPELRTWQNLISENLDAAGWPVVRVSQLAAIKGLPSRTQLTKKQSTSLLSTADALGIAVEPDARLTGKNYRWDEQVVLYHDDATGVDTADLSRYRAAALLLQLGVTIASADGVLDEQELSGLAGCLEREFDLGPQLTRRLEGLKHLLLVSGKTETSVTTAVRKSLPVAQRSMIGRYLVAIAAADRIICDKERKSLKKAFRALGIPAVELIRLLLPYDSELAVSDGNSNDVDESSEIGAPVLDLERIRAIREETRQVQDMLHAALTNTEAESDNDEYDRSTEGAATNSVVDPSSLAATSIESAITVPTSVGLHSPGTGCRLEGIPERYRAFFEAATKKERWRRGDMSQLARDNGLMLNAACEALNEWSTEVAGDWLFEDNEDEVVVHRHLLETL